MKTKMDIHTQCLWMAIKLVVVGSVGLVVGTFLTGLIFVMIQTSWAWM